MTETRVARVGFAGTPEFARTALAAILAAGYDVPLVLTQPDRPAGRGLKLQASVVKQLAAAHGIAVAQPRGLRLDGRHADDAARAQQTLREAALDVLVVAAYGLILPPWLLVLPRRGCINIHASLLPRWRGAAPIQRAIEAGDGTSGITIMQMDAGLDTGPMLLAGALPIEPGDSAATLHDKLATLGGGLVVDALRQAASWQPLAQPETGATYAAKIDKAEAAIDWRQPAAAIERRIRALDPFPGCTAAIAGETVKVWLAAVADGQGEPGTLLPGTGERLVVACGGGALELLQLQRTGGRRAASADVLRGWPQAQAAARGGR